MIDGRTEVLFKFEYVYVPKAFIKNWEGICMGITCNVGN